MRALIFAALLLLPSIVFAAGSTGYDIARGNDAQFSGFWKFGFNEDVGTVEETIWDGGVLYEYIAIAATLNVSSSSTVDSPAGLGASHIELSGLDENFQDASETITLNGQTAVVTTNKYIRLFRMKVVNSIADPQSQPENVGDVYAGLGGPSSGVPTSPYAKITAGEGQTLMSLWTVPEIDSDNRNIRYACLEELFVTTAGGGSGIASLRLVARNVTGASYTPFQVKDKFKAVASGGPTAIDHKIPICFDPKTDIEVRGAASTGTIDISAGMSFVIVY